jgi:hypothetical protein
LVLVFQGLDLKNSNVFLCIDKHLSKDYGLLSKDLDQKRVLCFLFFFVVLLIDHTKKAPADA